jgi:hypothetical protein
VPPFFFVCTDLMKQTANNRSWFTRQRLFQFLLGKSVVEALLVTVLGVSFYLVVSNPHLRGWLDQADSQAIAGWVVDEKSAGTRVEIQLFIDDRFIESGVANTFRPDVHASQRADDDWHGFVFKTPQLPPGTHEARVYAIHRGASVERRTLQIIGKPIKFQVGALTAGDSSR